MTTEGKLGTRIRKYREKLGLTQEQLALNAGLDAAFLADVEEDRVYPPSERSSGSPGHWVRGSAHSWTTSTCPTPSS
ncbi:MAG: helix-turn-helix transcriptional regulator [Candidatus Methanomethylophilaceae archaeon]|nr:helix-turn-helix transcriptional regulator [Candidatus Methanomethylophilaceae archaeon]